jgi:hypothetical protein
MSEHRSMPRDAGLASRGAVSQRTRWGRGGVAGLGGIALAAFLVFGVRTSATASRIEGFHLEVGRVEGRLGELVTIPVEASHERAVQGFSFAARFPAERLAITRIHIEDTLLEAIDTDFVEAAVDAARGELTLGVLVDAEPPFHGTVIPNVGRPLPYFYIEARIAIDAALGLVAVRGVGAAADQEPDLVVEMADGLGTPPVDNLFAVDNLPVAVAELTRGGVRLASEDIALFLRGDVTIDESVDVSDAIAILDYRFRGRRQLGCLDAADTNDDEQVDISDAIYLLGFLFAGTSPPPPPTPGIGADPTDDELGCAEPFSTERRWLLP